MQRLEAIKEKRECETTAWIDQNPVCLTWSNWTIIMSITQTDFHLIFKTWFWGDVGDVHYALCP